MSIGENISITDKDAGEGAIAALCVVSLGNLSLPYSDPQLLLERTEKKVSIFGPINNVNKALKAMRYYASQYFAGKDTLIVNVNDRGFSGPGEAKADKFVMAITIEPVNDPPVIFLPESGVFTATENKDLLLSGLSIRDPDVGEFFGSIMNLNISVSHGNLFTSKLHGVDVVREDFAIWNKTKTKKGGINRLNGFLQDLYYRSTDNWSGIDKLLITVGDNGNTGVGGEYVATGNVPITVVMPHNDEIVLSCPTGYVTHEDSEFEYYRYRD